MLLLLLLNTACGFKRIGDFYFDKRCQRDLPGIWSGDSCPAKAELPANDPLDDDKGQGQESQEEAPCALAINPSLCIRDGIEDSVWRSQEHTAHIALGYNLSFQSYYEFKTAGQYTHYLFFKHPFLNKIYYEKREGALDVQPNDLVDSLVFSHTLNFRLTASSCLAGSRPSLFRLFDNSNLSHIARNDYQLTLSSPDLCSGTV